MSLAQSSTELVGPASPSLDFQNPPEVASPKSRRKSAKVKRFESALPQNTSNEIMRTNTETDRAPHRSSASDSMGDQPSPLAETTIENPIVDAVADNKAGEASFSGETTAGLDGSKASSDIQGQDNFVRSSTSDRLSRRSSSKRPKGRSHSAAPRGPQLLDVIQRSPSIVVSKKKKKPKNSAAPEPVSIETARLRLASSKNSTLLVRAHSFHGMSHLQTSSTPSSARVRQPFALMQASESSSSLLSSSNQKLLLRTNSFPQLRSWEYGQLEVDLWLPQVGFVYDHLYRKVWRKKRKKKLSDMDGMLGTEDSGMVSVPTASRESDADVHQGDSVAYKEDGEERLVMGGTLKKLLTLLADQNVQDKDYIDIFLSTHLHFIGSNELLTYLVEYFSNPSEFAEVDDSLRTLIQVRVVNVLKKWIRNHPYEFKDDSIMATLNAFMNKLEESDAREIVQLAAILRDAWSKRDQNNAEVFEFDSEPPKSILPKKKLDTDTISFLDLDPQEVARQLTLIHYKMFAEIRNPHLVLATKEDKDPQNPVNIISAFSDRINRWCISELALAESVKRRTEILQNMIRLCQRLIDLQNFHGAMDIFLAVSHFLVGRLKRTWKSIDRSSNSLWKQISDTFNPSGGWRNLRKTIHRSNPPIIIPPAIWLHDLLSIAENDAHWDENQRMINFEKMRLFSAVFKNVYRCQVQPYHFNPVENIQDFLLKGCAALSSDELEIRIDELIPQEASSKKQVRNNSASSSGSSASASIGSVSNSSSSVSAPSSPPTDAVKTLKRRSSLADFLGRFKISK